MGPKLRGLYLEIWAGVRPPHAVTARLHYLDSFFPKEKLEPALRYLVRNKLIGDRFVQWIEYECFGSNLEMHRQLMRQVEKEKITRPLFAQKDLRR